MDLRLFSLQMPETHCYVVAKAPGEALDFAIEACECDLSSDSVQICEMPKDCRISTSNGDRTTEALIALAKGRHPVQVDAWMNEVVDA